MARLESDHGRPLVSFLYLTRRCREYIGLKDTRENRRVAAEIVREIGLELAGGNFEYAMKFPLSRNLERLGLKKCSAPMPSLVDFGQDWIEERRVSGRTSDATAYDYRRIFETHVLCSDLGAKQLDEIHDGHINALIGKLRARPGIHKGSTLGPRRINMTRGLLHSIYVTAQRRNWFRRIRSLTSRNYANANRPSIR